MLWVSCSPAYSHDQRTCSTVKPSDSLIRSQWANWESTIQVDGYDAGWHCIDTNRKVIASANRQGLFIAHDVNISQLFYCKLSGIFASKAESQLSGFWESSAQLFSSGNVESDIYRSAELSSGVWKSIKASRIALRRPNSAGRRMDWTLSVRPKPKPFGVRKKPWSNRCRDLGRA